MRGLITTLFVGFFLTTAALPLQANAQTTCFDRAKFAKKLETQNAKSPVSMGLANTGGMVEIFASTKGSFTILLTQPDGKFSQAGGRSWVLSGKFSAVR
jgi:hypothetical protein